MVADALEGGDGSDCLYSYYVAAVLAAISAVRLLYWWMELSQRCNSAGIADSEICSWPRRNSGMFRSSISGVWALNYYHSDCIIAVEPGRLPSMNQFYSIKVDFGRRNVN